MKKIYLNIVFIFIIMLSYSQEWVPFGGDTIYYPSPGNTTVRGLKKIQDKLYASGNFLYGGMDTLTRVGCWDTFQWNGFGLGINSGSLGAYCFQQYNNELYMGGGFYEVNYTANTEFIAKWNGSIWLPVPNSYGLPSNYVKDMIIYNNNLIIGGGFNAIGTNNTFYGVVGYNGSDYFNMGQMPDDIRTLEIYNGELYAGGWWFSLKKYVGSTIWEDVGGHTNYFIQDMDVDTFNNFLYVGGGFNVVDDIIITDNVAIWNGFYWEKIGGTGGINDVLSVGIYRGDVYTGRILDTTAGVFTQALACWDGQNWSMVGGGVNYSVDALEVYDDMLYVGGTFTRVNGDTVKALARWYVPPDSNNCRYLKPRVFSDTTTYFLINDSAEVQFYNNNAYAESWSWDFGDTGTDTIKDPLHIYTDTGTYNVSVTVSHQYCTKTAEKTIFIVDDTGIGIPSFENLIFKLYPNPSDGNFYASINLTGFKNLSGLLIKITCLNGHLKTTIPVTTEKTLINTTGWAKGTYVCNLSVKGRLMKSEKMILK